MKADQQKQIAERIEEICQRIEETATTAWNDVKRELEHLRIFGDDFIDDRFGHVPLVMHIVGKAPTKAVGDARIISLPQPAAGSAPAPASGEVTNGRGKGKRRKRRTASNNGVTDGTLSYTETGPLVVNAVKRIGPGNQFRMADVCEILRQENVKFNPSHVSLILAKRMKNVRKLGIQPSPNGRPANVFIISERGTPALK